MINKNNKFINTWSLYTSNNYIIFCRKLSNIVQSLLKNKKKFKNPPSKPEILPMTSMEQIEAFQHVERDVYLSVVILVTHTLYVYFYNTK